MKDFILKNILTGEIEKICIKVCKVGIPINSDNYSVFILSNNINLDGFPANKNDKENYNYSYVISDLNMDYKQAYSKFKEIISKPYSFSTLKGKYIVIVSKSNFEEIEL